MNIKYGMILAAGLGKRMQPLTLKTPKPLLEINNYTLLERAINLLISHGVQEISINVLFIIFLIRLNHLLIERNLKLRLQFPMKKIYY